MIIAKNRLVYGDVLGRGVTEYDEFHVYDANWVNRETTETIPAVVLVQHPRGNAAKAARIVINGDAVQGVRDGLSAWVDSRSRDVASHITDVEKHEQAGV